MNWTKVIIGTGKSFMRLLEVFVVRDDGGWNPWMAAGREREWKDLKEI